MARIPYGLIKRAVLLVALIVAVGGALLAQEYWEFPFERGLFAGMGLIMLLGGLRMPPPLYSALLTFAESRRPLDNREEFELYLCGFGMLFIALALLGGDLISNFLR